MRRMMMLVIAVGFLGSMAGCHWMHSHGICDCEVDDHCSTRSPWVRYALPISSSSEVIPNPPLKLPDGKKL